MAKTKEEIEETNLDDFLFKIKIERHVCPIEGRVLNEPCCEECDYLLNTTPNDYTNAVFNCSILAASLGEHSLRIIGKYLGITRERVRQIEVSAIKKIKRRLRSTIGETAKLFVALKEFRLENKKGGNKNNGKG